MTSLEEDEQILKKEWSSSLTLESYQLRPTTGNLALAAVGEKDGC